MSAITKDRPIVQLGAVLRQRCRSLRCRRRRLRISSSGITRRSHSRRRRSHRLLQRVSNHLRQFRLRLLHLRLTAVHHPKPISNTRHNQPHHRHHSPHPAKQHRPQKSHCRASQPHHRDRPRKPNHLRHITGPAGQPAHDQRKSAQETGAVTASPPLRIMMNVSMKMDLPRRYRRWNRLRRLPPLPLPGRHIHINNGLRRHGRRHWDRPRAGNLNCLRRLRLHPPSLQRNTFLPANHVAHDRHCSVTTDRKPSRISAPNADRQCRVVPFGLPLGPGGPKCPDAGPGAHGHAHGQIDDSQQGKKQRYSP